MGESFRWLSPLGASVGLFLAIGLLWLMIGALTVPFHNRGAGTESIFVSHSTDREYFGTSPSELLSSDPALSKLRTLLLTVIAGFLLLAGTLYLFVAWFGLKQGELWASCRWRPADWWRSPSGLWRFSPTFDPESP